MDFSQVQHVVQSQHSRRSLGEVQGWVDMVLEKPDQVEHEMRGTT